MAWTALLMAGVFEVGFTTALRMLNAMGPGTGQAHRLGLTAVFIGLVIGSFHFLEAATKTIPMGMAYAIWTGIGAVGTVLVGAAFFQERLDAVRLVLLAVIVAAIAGLKLIKA
ncbi:MAG: multidrug efflux SMR transporter [Alphaproteobacteria bacterium]|nr:multidrug efflux SMR transporter [Alphaproteobacteria bacterium]